MSRSKKEERGIEVALKQSSWGLVRRALEFWVSFDDSPEKEEAGRINDYIGTKVKEEVARRRDSRISKRPVVIEEHRLSDGQLTGVKRHGRCYFFYRNHPDSVELLLNLSKSGAMQRLADALKADVLETE